MLTNKPKFLAAIRRAVSVLSCLWDGHRWERTHVLNSRVGRLDLYRCTCCGEQARRIIK